MLVLDRHNRSLKLVDILNRAKPKPENWHFVNIKILNGSKKKLDSAVSTMLDEFYTYEGAIFKVSDYKILIIGNFGKIDNHGKFRRQIEKKIYKLGCRVVTENMSEEILSKIEVDYVLRDGKIDDSLYQSRMSRIQNHYLVIDDSQSILDKFQKILGKDGNVTCLNDPGKASEIYVECNPDMVFLDINMPGVNGFDVLEELKNLDSDAFIVMVSTESHKENILNAVSNGAVGFLTKPPHKDRLRFYIESCATISTTL